MRVPPPAPRDDSREGRSHAAAAARRWKGAAGLAAASLPPLASPPPAVSSVCLCPSVPCEDAVPGVRATCSRATASQILHVSACAQTAFPDEVPCLA